MMEVGMAKDDRDMAVWKNEEAEATLERERGNTCSIQEELRQLKANLMQSKDCSHKSKKSWSESHKKKRCLTWAVMGERIEG